MAAGSWSETRFWRVEPFDGLELVHGRYQILATVIERVSEQPLPQFAREQIFEPLGMTETLFEDNYAAILNGRVESYRPLGNGRYERILKHFDVYGDGGVITTLEDLVRWDQALRDDRVGEPGLAEMLLTRGRLETGAELTYAFGLDVYEYKGHRVIEHGGGILGFTVDMMRFPNDDLTVIALANTPEVWSTTMAFRVADLFLDDESSPASLAPTSLSLTAAGLARYAGCYWSAEKNFYRRVHVRDGRLLLDAAKARPPPHSFPSTRMSLSTEAVAIDGRPSPTRQPCEPSSSRPIPRQPVCASVWSPSSSPWMHPTGVVRQQSRAGTELTFWHGTDVRRLSSKRSWQESPASRSIPLECRSAGGATSIGQPAEPGRSAFALRETAG